MIFGIETYEKPHNVFRLLFRFLLYTVSDNKSSINHNIRTVKFTKTIFLIFSP